MNSLVIKAVISFDVKCRCVCYKNYFSCMDLSSTTVQLSLYTFWNTFTSMKKDSLEMDICCLSEVSL